METLMPSVFEKEIHREVSGNRSAFDDAARQTVCSLVSYTWQAIAGGLLFSENRIQYVGGENPMRPYDHSRRNRIITAAFFLALIAAVTIAITLGRYPVTMKELFGVLGGKLLGTEPFWETRTELIILSVRLPRILLAVMVGLSLSGAGAAYQGIFQNPLASPDILGATAGAAFGAAVGILLQGTSQLIILSAFCFSLLTVTLVWWVSQKVKGKRILSLVLSGMIVSALFSAGTSAAKLLADPYDQLPAITYWLMGSLASTRMQDVWFMLIPMLLGAVPSASAALPPEPYDGRRRRSAHHGRAHRHTAACRSAVRYGDDSRRRVGPAG